MRVERQNNRPPRVALRRAAKLVNSDGFEQNVTILDVSSGGFRLEVSDLVRIDEFVTLHVEKGLQFAGQIRWALGNDAGGKFLTPVDDAAWF